MHSSNIVESSAKVIFRSEEYGWEKGTYAAAYIEYGDLKYFGQSLLVFISNIEVGKCYNDDCKWEKSLFNFANGIDCLVAQFYRKFKTNIGNLYYTHPSYYMETVYTYYIDVMKTGDIFFSIEKDSDFILPPVKVNSESFNINWLMLKNMVENVSL